MTNTAIEWPSAIVAVVLLVMIGAVTIAGINRYPTTTEALEIWSSLSPVVGLISGAFVTYFFTRGAIQWDTLLNADPTIRLAIGGSGCP